MSLSHELLGMENVGLAWGFRVSPSSCENPLYYSQYIQLSAMGDQKSGQSMTHVLVDDEIGLLAGYVSLRATSLISVGENGLPVVHPTIEIAELAVDERYERKGVGTELVNIALGAADFLRQHWLGIKYIAVCADPSAVGFYEKEGFRSVATLYEIPRDGWNDNCVPMYIALPEE